MAVYFTEAVLKAVEDAFVSGFQAQLTQAETDASLTAGTLTPPEEYLRDYFPEDDRQILQVYAAGDMVPHGPAGQRNRIYEMPVMVVFRFRHDADAEGGAVRLTQYQKAMAKVVEIDCTLGGASGIVQASITAIGEVPKESPTLRDLALQLEVIWAYTT